MGAVTAAHERSVILGKDIGFVGFDAVDLCRIVSPPLSIVEQPTQMMGQKAGEILLKRMSGETPAAPAGDPPEKLSAQSDLSGIVP